jgi:hypothetical protein
MSIFPATEPPFGARIWFSKDEYFNGRATTGCAGTVAVHTRSGWFMGGEYRWSWAEMMRDDMLGGCTAYAELPPVVLELDR